MIYLISISGCVIGSKENVRIIYSSFVKTPEEASGAIRIATNDKIPVTIVGEKDVSTELDLGGYYAVSGQDLKGFIDALAKGR